MQSDAPSVRAALEYARANAARFTTRLAELVRFASVSGDASRRDDVRLCAEWLVRTLRTIGLPHARLIETSGAPLVFASLRRSAPNGRATILVYGHYDVQPPGPSAEWHSPPFTPTIRDGAVVGRGASDDKGQLLAHVNAIESWIHTAGELPVNVVCLFEGEEEIGSPALRRFLRTHGPRLGVQAAIISDTRMRAVDRPAITYALRGKMRIELVVLRRGREVHAGEFAGAVFDPARALASIVASLHEPGGRIAVDGFHDSIRVASAAERTYMKRVGPSDAEILGSGGLEPAPETCERSLYERTTLDPAISVTELQAGDAGEHGKSAIPARTSAMLDLRLVAGQDPRRIAQLVRTHARRFAPPGAHVALRIRSASPALVLDPRNAALRAGARAAEATFGRPVVFLRSGGTIPVVDTLASLGIPTVLLGFALADDGMHAPNERFGVRRFAQATECAIRFLAEAGRTLSPRPLQ
ncbi:MAG: Acetylornithine deacetylase/Succinyl-diaminopimelate desuccinylase [Gemmatimonadetes bacterium]|nr:Acetylornithine deacetylase/Succinyl-diaminopimelate desuccinylase [Gemmatimonadota bacterium]